MDQNKQNKTVRFISNYLLYFSAITFVLLYLVLAFHNRPTFDDLTVIFFMKGKNLFQYVYTLYETFGGRWTSWAYFFTVISPSDSNFQSIPICTFIYYCFTLFIFIYSVNKIIQIGIYKLFNTKVDSKTAVTYSILFIACFYFFTFQNIEAWWYICASFIYLQGIVFLLFGVALMLREKKKWFHYILISISFIYVGSCFEIYPLIIDSLFGVCIIYFLLKNKNDLSLLRNHWFYKGFTTAFISLSISACIIFLAPSNLERRAYFKENYTQFYHPTNVNTVLNVFADRKFIVAIGLSSLWLLLGIKLKNNSTVIINKDCIKKIFLLSITALLFSVIILYLFQKIFTYGIMPPARSWTFTSFTLAFFICFLFFLIGYFNSFLKLYLQYAIQICFPLIILVVLSLNLYKQYSYTSVYAKKYDQLIESFLEAKKNNITGPFYMEPLPQSGMLMQFDMDDDSSNPKFFKKILGLDYDIIVKK